MNACLLAQLLFKEAVVIQVVITASECLMSSLWLDVGMNPMLGNEALTRRTGMIPNMQLPILILLPLQTTGPALASTRVLYTRMQTPTYTTFVTLPM